MTSPSEGRRALVGLALGLCAAAPGNASAEAGTWQRALVLSGTVDGVTGTGKVNVFLPAGYSPTRRPAYRLLLALHGWRGHADDWERNSPLAYHASQRGYVIVAPSLGTTVYERSFFPETQARGRWGAIPGGRWLGEVVVPTLRRRYNVQKSASGTGVFGLSTGGRGAALLPAYYRGMFGAFASLSGDYDITMAPRERTATFVYGPYSSFPERWRADNSRFLLDRLEGVAALLIHGAKDRICPAEQSRRFAAAMKQRGLEVTLLEDPNLGHDWKLWSGYLGTVFAHFDAKLR